MKRLEQLRRQLSDALDAIEELNNSVVDGEKVRSFTEEEQTKYDELTRSLGEIKSAIAREEELEESRSQLGNLDKTIRKAPRIEVVREENHNEEGEFRGYREMGKGGFGDFLMDVRKAASGDKASETFEQLRAATGANEGVGADGGFLVQSDHAEMLFTNAKDAGKVASRCTTIPVSGNSTTINMVDETSLATGSRFGGVQAYFRAEAGQVSASKPKFREEMIKLEALEALFYATEEQLEDAAQLEKFADMAFRSEMAWVLDDKIISGTGNGCPLGILNAPCTITIAKESGQTADTIVYDNLDKMADRLLVGSEDAAVWYHHPDARKQIRNVVATPGSLSDFAPYLMAGGPAHKGQLVDPINGYPMERVQQCKALGDKGDIVLADFSHYLLFQKSGIKASQSMHVAFLTSERVFKWTQRVAGQPAHNSAITDAYGSTTRSPFVVLAERA